MSNQTNTILEEMKRESEEEAKAILKEELDDQIKMAFDQLSR